MRAAATRPNIKVVHINDPFISVPYMEYMYKYDTVHGRAAQKVQHDEVKNLLIVDGKPINVSAEKVRTD